MLGRAGAIVRDFGFASAAAVERFHRLVEREFQIVVARQQQRFQGHLLGSRGLHAPEEAGGTNGLQTNAGMLVAGLHLEQPDRIADPVAPIAQHPRGGCPGLRLGAAQQLLEHVLVDDVVGLEHPQPFQPVVPIVGIGLVERGEPFPRVGDHLVGLAVVQGDAGPIAGAVFIDFQLVQQLGIRGPGDFGRRDQRTILVADAPDAAMGGVAVADRGSNVACARPAD